MSSGTGSLLTLIPGRPASEYPAGELWDHTDHLDELWQARKRYNREYGFCLFTAEVVTMLAEMLAGKKVLEAGSGSGWLSEQLGHQGVDILASDWTDYRVAERGRGYAIENVFRLDHHCDSTDLLPGEFDAVILVWPNLDTPFGDRVLEAMRAGQLVFFEGEGRGGCTASDEFFDRLDRDFLAMPAETDRLNSGHRTLPGLYDEWQIALKK